MDNCSVPLCVRCFVAAAAFRSPTTERILCRHNTASEISGGMRAARCAAFSASLVIWPDHRDDRVLAQAQWRMSMSRRPTRRRHAEIHDKREPPGERGRLRRVVARHGSAGLCQRSDP